MKIPPRRIIKYKVKKIFNGSASLRDYVVKDAIGDNTRIDVWFRDEHMILSVEELKEGKRSSKDFIGKWGGKYYLIDFKWNPIVNLKLF